MLVAGRAFFLMIPGFCLLCYAAGVPGAACAVLRAGLLCVPVDGGPPASRPRRELRSARPPSTAHDLPSSVWSLCVPVGGGPPARSPHASLTARSGRFRGPPWPCRHPPAPRPGPPDSVAHPQPTRPALTPLIPEPHPISHVIPLRLLQVLNLDRWNCNVFRLR